MRKLISNSCLECGKAYMGKSGSKFCSRRCSGIVGARRLHEKSDQSGENNPNWRNGRSSDPYNSYVKSYKQKNPLKIKAHNLINTEIRSGRIKRLPCQECGALKVDAHHEDYFKPYDIIWLCRSHHNARHRR